MPAPQPWYGVRRLDDGLSRVMFSLEKRPGTVVTVSVLQRDGHRVSAADLTRRAAAVEIPVVAEGTLKGS